MQHDEIADYVTSVISSMRWQSSSAWVCRKEGWGCDRRRWQPRHPSVIEVLAVGDANSLRAQRLQHSPPASANGHLKSSSYRMNNALMIARQPGRRQPYPGGYRASRIKVGTAIGLPIGRDMAATAYDTQ